MESSEWTAPDGGEPSTNQPSDQAQESPVAVAPPPPEPQSAEQEDPPRGAIAEWTVTILLLLFGTTTLIQAYVIPSGSMENTLLIGDHLLVDKMAYAPSGPISKYLLPYEPVKRGDIIVFRYPVNIRQTFVKRVIGIPGDRIRLVNKQVYVNGVKLNEPYAVHKTDSIDAYRDDFPSELDEPDPYNSAEDMLLHHVVNGEVVVPPGCYFAMGDNRDLSLDSRYWGFVPRQNIIGKPLMIYWSYDAPTSVLANPSITLSHLKDLALNFFNKTRWRRTFKLIHGYPIKADPVKTQRSTSIARPLQPAHAQ
jgi:signal peptidase I